MKAGHYIEFVMEGVVLNMQTSFEETSFPTKVGPKDQPNTQIDKSICLQALDYKSKANMQTKPTKHVHFSIPQPKLQLQLQQPSFFIAPYRTIPLEPLPILPVQKWNNPYSHVQAKVGSYRTN